MFLTRTVGVHVSILAVLCPLQSPSCAFFCFAAIMLCPRCNRTLCKSTAGKQNWSKFQTRQGTPVCMDKMNGRRFNCCSGCSPTYFRLYPTFDLFNPAMRFGDEEWCALCNALRDAWSAADWSRRHLACNVSLSSEFQELLLNIGIESGTEFWLFLWLPWPPLADLTFPTYIHTYIMSPDFP